MKKILIYILFIPLVFGSCTDKLDEDWQDPQVYQPKPNEVISGLFTHMQKTRFFVEDYGEWYWFLSGWYQSFLGTSQLAEFLPYNTTYSNIWADYRYGSLDDFMDNANGNTYNRFSRLYTDLNNYGLIRDELAVLDGDDLNNNIIYGKLSTLLKDVVALQTVDLFNSIPYFDAYKGTQGVLFTPYDDPLTIYKAVIEEYQSIAQELPTIYSNMSTLSQSTFATQDIYFKGDVTKWVQFVNAHILKACIRISGVAPDYVKPFMTEAIKNLPSKDFTFVSPYVNENRVGTSSGGIVWRGRYEQYYALAIPDVIMCRMNRGQDVYELGIDDPRLPAIAMGYNKDGLSDAVEYYGVSGNWERNKYLRNLPEGGGQKRNTAIRPQYSMDVMVKSCPWTFYNPITYVLGETPFYLFSMAEVDLLLAEAELKSLVSTGSTAGEHINNAVQHSTDFWYAMNSVTNYAGSMADDTKKILTPTKPDAAVISSYASTIQNEFNAASVLEDKMEIIMQQKYIHLNVWQAFECFAELRRTRHPKLEPITCKGTSSELVNATMMLERFTLPPSEKANNYDEYSKVMADDKWGTPIFWVTTEKVTETYFRSEAIKSPLP
ncbi:MAG: SusD/RagB family nutrient-binding outer membrane lipoprotein [Mangrovibacterium sp.]